MSPIAGRFSDRAGRLAPIRVGLTGAVIMAVVLPLPRTVVLVGLCVTLTFVALASFWAPGMAMLSDAAEEAGLDLALAFAISNLAWALGHVFGAGGAARSPTPPPTGALRVLAVLCAMTLAGLTLSRRRQEALSA